MDLSLLRPTPCGSRIITFLSGRCYAMVLNANVARLMVGLRSRRATSSAGSARSGTAYIWFFVARTRGFPWTAMTIMIQQTAQVSVALLRATSMGLAWFRGAGGLRWLLSWSSSHLIDFPLHLTSCRTWQWSPCWIHNMSKWRRMICRSGPFTSLTVSLGVALAILPSRVTRTTKSSLCSVMCKHQSLLFRIHSQAVRVFACACFGASNTLHLISSFCSHAGHSLRLHLALSASKERHHMCCAYSFVYSDRAHQRRSITVCFHNFLQHGHTIYLFSNLRYDVLVPELVIDHG